MSIFKKNQNYAMLIIFRIWSDPHPGPLCPRDYLYKHCVSNSATYNKKKYEKCQPKVLTSSAPRMAPCENFEKK